MQYSISDLAEILGITTSAIRFLESERIIKAKKSGNGYRYYDTADVFRLLSYSKYKKMKIPLRAIGEQFRGEAGDRHMTRNRVAAAGDDARKLAEYYRLLALSINEHLESIDRIDHLLNRYEFIQSPDWTLFCDPGDGWISKDREIRRQISLWVEAMPAVHIGAVRNLDSEQVCLGYLTRTENVTALALPTDSCSRHLPPASCLHTICIAENTFAEQPQSSFRQALAYAEKRGFQVSGDAVAKAILVEVDPEAGIRTYVELWLPIS